MLTVLAIVAVGFFVVGAILAVGGSGPLGSYLVILGILLGLVWSAIPAIAHDNPDNWIGQERRKNADGVLCCGNSDCRSFTVDEVKIMPDGYHFPDGEVVAFKKAAPSIDHFYWKCVWGGETKCVFAPLGAS